MDPLGFLQYYFVRPLFDCSGYNIYNTLGFIVVLAIITAIIARIFKREKMKFDENFFWMIVPYILLGGILRSIEDLIESPLGCVASRQENPWLVLFITPFIYLVMLTLTATIVFTAKKTTKDYQKNTQFIGWVLVTASAMVVLYNGIYWTEFLSMAVLSVLLLSILYFAFKKTKTYSKAGLLVAYGQLVDASASAIAVELMGYGEQHVLSAYVMNIHPFLFVPLKMVLAFLIVYSVEKEKKDKWKWIIFSIVLMIGLAPGVRDALRALMGV